MKRLGSHYSACALLLLLGSLAGCRHKMPPPPPPATAPPAKPAPITVITPLPPVPPKTKPDVQPAPLEKPTPTPIPTPAPVKHKRRLHRKPPAVAATPAAGTAQSSSSNAAPSALATTPAATTATSSEAADGNTSSAPGSKPGSSSNPGSSSGSAPATEAAPSSLGELSAGTTISREERTRMLREIEVQEARMLTVKKPLTSEANTVQAQVHTFLTKARQAVDKNDLDGAQTLNTKARVLLDELQSE